MCSLRFISYAPTTTISCRYSKQGTVSCRAINSAAEHKTTTNFYKVLSLESETAGAGDIKKAYRSMARRWHPDACVDPSRKEECTRVFIQLQRAYETLSNPALRTRHDIELFRHGGGEEEEDGAERRVEYFSRDVWEAQLRELRRRSDLREGRRRMMAGVSAGGMI